MRAPGLTWFRLPLFVWALYATSLIQMLGTPVVAITIVMLAVERVLRLRHLRPDARRRPGALPAPLLVLLAPGGLHHDPAGDGRDQRGDPCFSRKTHLRLLVRRLLAAWRSPCSASWCGRHHMFVAGISPYSAMVFSFLTFSVAIPSAVKTFNWTATLYKGAISFKTPMLYAFGFIGLFLIGGLTGLFLAAARPRRPPARHLLRGGALPLHHGGRRHHGLPRRPPLLVAEDHGPDVLGVAGAHQRDPGLRRLQPDVLPAVHPGLHGHAAALPRLPATSSRCST